MNHPIALGLWIGLLLVAASAAGRYVGAFTGSLVLWIAARGRSAARWRAVRACRRRGHDWRAFVAAEGTHARYLTLSILVYRCERCGCTETYRAPVL